MPDPLTTLTELAEKQRAAQATDATLDAGWRFDNAAYAAPFAAVAEQWKAMQARDKQLRSAGIKLAAFICRLPSESEEEQEVRSEGLRLVQAWKYVDSPSTPERPQ